MKKTIKMTCLIWGIAAGAIAQQGAPGSVAEVASDIATNIGKVSGFTATVETGENAESDSGAKIKSSLKVSRLYGWKMEHEGPDAFILVTDFNTFYHYVPKDKQVLKTTADTPAMKAMLTKPVTDMNPIALLDPKSLTYLGLEKVNGDTVYHVEGTTQSQLMPGGPAVKRNLSAWISTEDGLPRKTVESVGMSTGTTVYTNVKINPDLSPADFSFTPPPGIRVIDTNAEMRLMQEQMHKPGTTPAPEN